MLHALQNPRATYLQQALDCISHSPRTSETLIELTLTLDNADKDRWLEDVDICLKQNQVATARHLLKYALILKDSKKLWLKAYQLEVDHGDPLSIFRPSKHLLVSFLHAKTLWKRDRGEEALGVLSECEPCDDQKVAMNKILRSLKRCEEALKILEGTDEVVQKVSTFREMGRLEAALEACQNVSWKNFLQKCQILEEMGRDVREVFTEGVKKWGQEEHVWVQFALYEQR